MHAPGSIGVPTEDDRKRKDDRKFASNVCTAARKLRGSAGARDVLETLPQEFVQRP